MFEGFFGCTGAPFGRNLGTKDLFDSDGHREMVSRMVYAARSRKFALCTGEVGAGKSTGARTVSEQLDPARYRVLYITDSDLTPRNFYYEVLHQLDIPPRFYRGDAKRQLNKALLTLHENKKTPVILIDEGHLLKREMLEEIRFLMNFRMDSFSPLSLILMGQPELRRTLQSQVYEAISQRINVRFHLPGLSSMETKGYISHHLKVVGVQHTLFTDESVHLIHDFSSGIARKINNICTGCLLHAFSKTKKLVDDHMVRIVIENEFSS